MTSPELSEWMAFDNLYGFPDLYFAVAVLCSTLEGLWSEKPRKPSEVIAFFAESEAIGQSPAEILGRLKTIAAAQKR